MVISLASTSPDRCHAVCGERRRVKSHGSGESGSSQSRQGDREETIGATPGVAHATLDLTGVEFIDENGGGPAFGNRLKSKTTNNPKGSSSTTNRGGAGVRLRNRQRNKRLTQPV